MFPIIIIGRKYYRLFDIYFSPMMQNNDEEAQKTLMPIDTTTPPQRAPSPRYNFRKYDQNQQFLLPVSLKEWIDTGSLVHFLDVLINHLDNEGALDPIYQDYRVDGWGAPAYHPRMMVKVIFYGICNGPLSTRKLARAIETNMELRYLSGNQLPDFRTICDFRNRHNEALCNLFTDILELCEEAGLVKVGRVSLDGTKMKANASMSKSYLRETIARKIMELMTEAKLLDDEEDQIFGSQRRGDELPEDLSDEGAQRKVIELAMKRLTEARKKQQEQREREKVQKEKQKKVKKRASDQQEPIDVDEDVGNGPAGDASSPQSVEEGSESGSGPSRHDLDRLERMVDAYDQASQKEREAREEQEEKHRKREQEEAETGKKKRGRKLKDPEEIEFPNAKGNITDPDSRIMVDGHGNHLQGYNCQAVVDTFSQIIVAFGVTQEENDFHQLIPMLEACHLNMGRMPGQCVADAGYWTDEHGDLFIDGCEMFINTMKSWKLREKLKEKGPPKGRIPGGLSKRDLMERKLLTRKGQKVYKTRYMSEAVYGQMDTRGQNRFLRRGIPKVTTDWSLICSSTNLMKLYTSRRWSISDSSLVLESVGG